MPHPRQRSRRKRRPGYAGDLHAVPVVLPDVLSGPLRAPPNGLALTVGKDLDQGALPGHGPAKQCDVEGPHPLPVAFRLPEGRLVGCGHVIHGFVRLPIDRVIILSPPSVCVRPRQRLRPLSCVLDDDVQLAQLFRRPLMGDGCRLGQFGSSLSSSERLLRARFCSSMAVAWLRSA